jgi:hypothetical protein
MAAQGQGRSSSSSSSSEAGSMQVRVQHRRGFTQELQDSNGTDKTHGLLHACTDAWEHLKETTVIQHTALHTQAEA